VEAFEAFERRLHWPGIAGEEEEEVVAHCYHRRARTAGEGVEMIAAEKIKKGGGCGCGDDY
jgi:hypothetical protein